MIDLELGSCPIEMLIFSTSLHGTEQYKQHDNLVHTIYESTFQEI